MHDIVKRARNHEYDDKTVLFCWVRFSTGHSCVGVCEESCPRAISALCQWCGERPHPSHHGAMQEHKNIPYIVGELGLSDHELHWGLNPESGVRPMAVVSG